jgi:uncharacterized protein (DUF362 family)
MTQTLPLHLSRRNLLAGTVRGLVGGLAVGCLPRLALGQSRPAATTPSRLALTAGDSRGSNIIQALRLIEADIRQGLARKKRLVLKPNVVMTNFQLAATHVECIEALLDFFSTFYKDEIIVAESSASGPTAVGYENYGYTRLASKYKVRFLDLDDGPTTVLHVSDHRFRPRPVRTASLLLDPDAYIVSTAPPKSHDRAVVTLSLKNIAVGAPVKDKTSHWGPGSKGVNDKPIIHGGPNNEAININLFQLAKRLHPDLAVIDGFQGMEHNGPVAGTPVDHKIAIASTDWLAADRVGVELMGFDFAKVGYLSFCAQAGMGQADLDKIEILGAKVADHLRKYRPNDNIEQQYKWMSRGNA